MKKIILLFIPILFLLQSCSNTNKDTKQEEKLRSTYLDYSQKDDAWTGGVKMITINTPKGEFKVWTKRVGNNPKTKVLLLHGGPGMTHEYFECFDSYFPNAEIEYYYYDQLESAYSDQPNDSSLWNIPHYVEEVEQVRIALGLDSTNFFLLGHSWGGILALEYALKYQKNMKALIISNMVASIPEYVKYSNEILGAQLDSSVLAEIRALEANNQYTSKRYEELVSKYFYTKHVLRRPLDEWPEPANRAFAKVNYPMYLRMQGPSEFGVVGNAKLKNWDRSKDLSKISVATLTIGGAYDTMDPKYMEWMSEEVQNGQFLLCTKGSHMSMYDDQKTYFEGLISFIKNQAYK